MSGIFKINYLTDENQLFTLTVPNAFDYDGDAII